MKYKYNKGLSLIQLIVGMAIGMIIIGMSINALINVQKSIKSFGGGSSVDILTFKEAEDIISQSIYSAGFDCDYEFNNFSYTGNSVKDSKHIQVLRDGDYGSIPFLYSGQFSFERGQPILTNNLATNGIIIDNYKPGSDFIVVQTTKDTQSVNQIFVDAYGDTSIKLPSLSSTNGMDKNDLLLSCDALRTYLLNIYNVSDSNIYIENYPAENFEIFSGAKISKYNFIIYYIGEDEDNKYSLYEYNLSSLNGATTTLLIPSISGMEVKYMSENSTTWVDVGSSLNPSKDRQDWKNIKAINISISIDKDNYSFDTLLV